MTEFRLGPRGESIPVVDCDDDPLTPPKNFPKE